MSWEEPVSVNLADTTVVFDINGDEDDADPACVPGDDGAFALGYNDATVSVSLPPWATAATGGVCGYVLAADDAVESATLTAWFMAGGDAIAREYPLALLIEPLTIRSATEAVTVAANATPGAVVLTASLSGGRNASFAPVTEGDFRAGGGVEAMVLLARAATAAFDADGLELFLTLTASDNDQEATAIARFVSSARVIDKGRVSLTITETRMGQTILAAGAAEISIWHNDNDGERYTLVQSASDFGVDATTGLVTAAANLAIDIYDITLQLRDESLALTASRAFRLIDPERWALLRFLERIEAGEIAWTDPDWDGDGIENPYDWTPTVFSGVTVNLTLDGTDPWPIYNVWQLQAIDGMSVSANGSMSGDLTLFGEMPSERLSRHYRLAVDIDATPTKKWKTSSGNTVGFNPIGGAFAGGFDGGGYAVRGLFINRFGSTFVGLFEAINSPHEITNLGVEEADILGNRFVGILAGGLESDVSRIWTTGKVVGYLQPYFGNIFGDVVGGLAGHGSANVHDSWSTADVRGIENLGGLIGQISGAGTVTLSDSWAAGDVSGTRVAGGFGGLVSGSSFVASFARNWAAGAVASVSSAGGFLGGGGATNVTLSLNYWNADTSGVANSPYGASALLQTLDAVDFGDDDSWHVGESGDFPLLTALDRPWQAVNLARALTRVLDLEDEATVAAGTTIRARFLRLDTNGLAADEGTDGTSTSTCSYADGVLRAETNYNGVTIELSLLAGGNKVFILANGCDVKIRSALNDFDATLRLEISAPAIDGDPARRLTTDYALRVAAHPEDAKQAARDALDKFVRRIAEDDFSWFSTVWIRAGISLDWDGDDIANPYDWTPTSIAVEGEGMIKVNLTLDGPNGTAKKPWLIYNIWQLQAIDGVSVAANGKPSGGNFAFFGANAAAALTAQYRLEVDIDARPTKEWKAQNGNATVGFNPISGDLDFTGYLDGGGYAVRDLFINRTGGNDHEIGLFGAIAKTGELAVSDLGVEEADIRGNQAVGILVGESTGASFSKVWTTGKVFGQVNIGGLAGQFIGGGATVSIEMSWSAADVEGNSFNVGGLIGQNSSTGQDSSDGVQNGLDDVHVNVVDNWAAGNVIGNQNVGGFAGNDDGVDHTRNWSSGAVTVFSNSASGGFAGFNISGSDDTYASSYWNEDTSDLTTSAGGKGVVVQTLTVSDFGGEAESAAWDFGDSDIADGVADFPLLKSSERPLQAVYLARALTRLLGVSDAAEIVAAAGTTITARGIRLDTNGLANNERTSGTSTPSCSVINGELRAETNYNRVTAKLILMTSGDEAFVAAGGCSARIANSTAEFAATLRLEISAPATLDDPARSLTTDYALRIAPDLSGQARAKFLAEIASGDREWLGGDSDDWDRDGVLNPYDWTPTSVIIGGAVIGVNLNLDDADGTAGLPWPIYNVWQLQAIDGETVAIDGLVSDSVHDAAASNLFGDSDAERLGAHYRLMADIDASPTRDWARQFVAGRANHALGFQPLGWNDSIFQGSFDGQGREIRNLFMRRGVLRAGPLTSDQGINAGLFAVVGAGATVRNLGLRDLDFRSDAGRFIGGLAGKVSVGLVSLVWATGVVEGEETIGGLAGLLEGGGEIADSWFVGKVEGIEDTGGGLVGASETGRIRDSWALAELSRGESNFDSNPIGGLIGRNGIASVLDNSWAIGLPPAEEGAGLIGDNSAQLIAQAYWDQSSSTVKAVGGVVPARVFSVDTMATVTDTDAEWSTTAWNFGRSDNNAADYPFLRGSEGFWPGRQALAFADFQTRLVADSGETLAMDGERITMRIDATLTLRLDTNGLAANDPNDADPTPTPSCIEDGEGVRAETNYNNVTVWLRATGGGELALSPSSNCVVEFTYPLSAQDRTAPVSLLLSIAMAESSLSRSHAVVASPFSARVADKGVCAV